MIRSLFTAALLLSTAVFAQAQAVANSPIKITDIKPSLESTPDFSITIGPQRKARSQQWLWIEVSFVYQSRTPQPLPELTLNYYVLLNDVSAQNRLGTLLTGTVESGSPPPDLVSEPLPRLVPDGDPQIVRADKKSMVPQRCRRVRCWRDEGRHGRRCRATGVVCTDWRPNHEHKKQSARETRGASSLYQPPQV